MIDDAKPRVGIFSHNKDLHAFAVADWLKRNGSVRPFIFETDNLLTNGSVSWSSDPGVPTILGDHKGDPVSVGSLDAVWWRRYRIDQIGREDTATATDTATEFSGPQWRTTLLGIALTDFRGAVINTPESQIFAESKMCQLRCAAHVGLRVPRTCVTQDPSALEKFRTEIAPNAIIAKLLSPPRSVPTETVMIEQWPLPDHLVVTAPTIYQEYVPGEHHLRVHCFGTKTMTCEIVTSQLDWRASLDGSFTEIQLAADLEEKLIRLNERLGIEFAIHDLKIDRDGNAFYLETNHQGQFLFIEGLGGGMLVEAFSTYIAEKAHHAFDLKS